QAAIVAQLKAAGTLAADRIYCPVPEGVKFPYVSIGNIQVINERFEGLTGAEVIVTLHAWSRANSRLEIRQLGREITLALDDADPALSGADLTVKSCLLETASYLDDPDGKTAHAVLSFHLFTD